MDGREHYLYILVFSILPFLGVVAAVFFLWNSLAGPSDMVALVIMSIITGLGVSTGYHRLLSHRSFKTNRFIKIFFTAGGAMAGQGPPLIWVAHHRRHHRIADKPGDPHSPWFEGEEGVRGAIKGLWHSHLGWLFDTKLTSDPVRYCPDLARDKDIRFISRYFVAFVLGGIVLPGLIGFALAGSVASFFTGMLWGGLVRMFVGNHVTYAVNSIGHYFGNRRFDTPDESRNVAWLSLISFGESWHNNHHAFPRSANHDALVRGRPLGDHHPLHGADRHGVGRHPDRPGAPRAPAGWAREGRQRPVRAVGAADAARRTGPGRDEGLGRHWCCRCRMTSGSG